MDAKSNGAQQEAEPVAWRYQYKNTPIWQYSQYEVFNSPPFDFYEAIEPLYTAPQPRIDLSKLKELAQTWKCEWASEVGRVNGNKNYTPDEFVRGLDSAADRLLALLAELAKDGES